MATTTAATTGAMSAEQIAAAAKQAGFPASDLPTAVAIALSESGGVPSRRNNNPTTRDDSYGLWQINMYGSLGPARRAAWGLKADSDLYDPLVNARAALSIRRSQGWAAWSDYTNGKFRRFLNETQAFSQGVDVPFIPFPIDIVGAGTEELAKALAAPLAWINRGVFRIAMFVGGGALIVMAVSMLVVSNQRKVLGVASSVVNPVKKGAKLAKAVQKA